jgi:hypothetical protein
VRETARLRHRGAVLACERGKIAIDGERFPALLLAMAIHKLAQAIGIAVIAIVRTVRSERLPLDAESED